MTELIDSCVTRQVPGTLSGFPAGGATAPVGGFSLAHTVLCKQLSIVYPQAVFLPPCNRSKLLSKDNGGTMVLFILRQRGKADNKSIYITLRLSRGLIFINELIFSSNNPFMRVVS